MALLLRGAREARIESSVAPQSFASDPRKWTLICEMRASERVRFKLHRRPGSAYAYFAHAGHYYRISFSDVEFLGLDKAGVGARAADVVFILRKAVVK